MTKENGQPRDEPMTQEERLLFGDRVFAIRDAHGLKQPDFAARFGVTLSAVKAWEGGRYEPLTVARLLVRVIELDPELVARAARLEAMLGCTVTATAEDVARA